MEVMRLGGDCTQWWHHQSVLPGFDQTTLWLLHTCMSRFANNELFGSGVRVRVWIREQRNIKRSKALLSL